MKRTIYVSECKEFATVVSVIGLVNKRQEESRYRLFGERWATPLEELKEIYPDAEIVYE